MRRDPEINRPRQIDLNALRQKVSGASGQEYWRSLEQLAETPEFQEYLKREFPDNAEQMADSVGRRRFLQLMGASLALAGLSGCTRQPPEKIVPYIRQPEQIVPGNPLYFATALTLGGRLRGVLAESHMGRPTKLEGNEMHPASLGATDLFTQAEILNLYDPDRLQAVQNAGRIRTWDGFSAVFRTAIEGQVGKEGQGLRILSETVTSPSMANQLERIQERFPQMRHHQYEPVNRDSALQGSRMALGEDLDVRYRFDQADVILSLDSDFLYSGPAAVRYARDLVSRRHFSNGPQPMNRLYVAECCHTNTGSFADHRLPLRASDIESLARTLAAELGIDVPTATLASAATQWAASVADELAAHRGSSIVIAGDHQSPAVHALACLMNHQLGNIGRTVEFTAPVDAFPVLQNESLRELVEAMQAGTVEMLIILGGNPVYTAPADLDFAAALAKVPMAIHLAFSENETARLCHWQIPAVHELESWGDGRAYDGTITIQQPLIEPLYRGRSAYELLAFLNDEEGYNAFDVVREYWETNPPLLALSDFEGFWQQSLHDGVVQDSALPARTPVPRADFSLPPAKPSQEMELLFLPDPTLYDGRYANNGWMQEIPKQLTKLTWDNAALISPRTAEKLGHSVQKSKGDADTWDISGRLAELTFQGRTLEVPLWVLPGHADNSVTLYLGSGRSHAGRVGNGTGFNAYALRTWDAPNFGTGLEVKPTSRSYLLACVQDHFALEGRNHVRSASLAEYQADPQFAAHQGHAPDPELTLYPEHDYSDQNAWGMSINLNACTGCNACVAACQSENNIPVVGKDQVSRGREMQWLRVDRYFQGGIDNPRTYHQPLPCMQCEKAPCEPVCPVGATVHSDEGLNDMVYNRCVGTRYCLNNCPYKVRRFNFYLFSDFETPSRKLAYNPDVTVRSRGVMEKCTYCVQRISLARIQAKREGRELRDGDIQTACQQVCPTQAIIFGDKNDPQSKVAQRKANPLDYTMLAELNTRPRTTYMAKVRNPNPNIQPAPIRMVVDESESDDHEEEQ